jgi:hypothetical protein
MQTNGKKTIVFIHIPKAAGSTLSGIFGRQYRPETIHKNYESLSITPEVLNTGLEDGAQMIIKIHEAALIHARKKYDAFQKLSESERRSIKVFQGHDGYGIHNYLPQPCAYVTMLRDPIDRIISHYYYVKRSPHHYLHAEVTAKKMALNDFVNSGLTPELDNSQTKYLAGLETPYLKFGEYSSELLAKAKEHINEKFILVGITEWFDETILLLKRKLNWRTPYYKRVNVTKNRPEKEKVGDLALQSIEKHNELDIQLYQYAKALFKKELDACGDSFFLELESFQKANKNYDHSDPYRNFLHKTIRYAKRAGNKILNR